MTTDQHCEIPISDQEHYIHMLRILQACSAKRSTEALSAEDPSEGAKIAFDEAAACALYNSGDRSWRLYAHPYNALVRLGSAGVVFVTINPDGTVEPE